MVSEGGAIFFQREQATSPQCHKGGASHKKSRIGGCHLGLRGLLLLPQWVQKAEHVAKEDCSHGLRYNGICLVKVLDLLGPVFPFSF